jgi:hypothetical protein
MTKNMPDTDSPINLVVALSLIDTKTKLSDECSIRVTNVRAINTRWPRSSLRLAKVFAGEIGRGYSNALAEIWFLSADYISEVKCVAGTHPAP